jgi:HNH endonuclease
MGVHHRDCELADPVERLLRKVDRSGSRTMCWPYLGKPNNSGYVFTNVGSRKNGTRKMVSAARLICERFHGPMPEDYEPDHQCKTRHCLNPDHIQAVPRSLNRSARWYHGE